jgi:16S rRNA (cytosine1402-N4)-methyltransferase
MHGAHAPVLLDEAVAALSIAPDAVLVDATFGRGGHARAMLAALGPRGRLVGVDRDPAAAAAAQPISDARFVFRHAWFSEVGDVLASLGIATIDGALFDLGVSSPQLDDAARGFSYRHDGPLDMRMDTTRGDSAAELIARADVRELTEIIRDYGEERFAQSIARAIAAARARQPIVTTRQLAAVVTQAVGARTRGDWDQDPAARTFQALRIAVNRELAELSMALPLVTALRSRAANRRAAANRYALPRATPRSAPADCARSPRPRASARVRSSQAVRRAAPRCVAAGAPGAGRRRRAARPTQ